jgi:D-beta-D-heptose 7-phosphate kinase/D-beta-D-heptose 1-phosphate adenosyltransferase
MGNSLGVEFLTVKVQQLKIAVIGDVMLDRYFYGEVKRISPEAPVPVNHVKRITSVLGGAGNVAANLAHLGCKVYMGGVTGRDDNRKLLEGKLKEAGINYSGLVPSPKRSTITKLRIIGARQQMVRLDFEEVGDLLNQEGEKLLAWLQKMLKSGLDGIVLSDYAKGVCSQSFCQRVLSWLISIKCRFWLILRAVTGQNIQAVILLLPTLKKWERQ